MTVNSSADPGPGCPLSPAVCEQVWAGLPGSLTFPGILLQRGALWNVFLGNTQTQVTGHSPRGDRSGGSAGFKSPSLFLTAALVHRQPYPKWSEETQGKIESITLHRVSTQHCHLNLQNRHSIWSLLFLLPCLLLQKKNHHILNAYEVPGAMLTAVQTTSHVIPRYPPSAISYYYNHHFIDEIKEGSNLVKSGR